MNALSQTLKTYLLKHTEVMTEKWLSMRKMESDSSIYCTNTSAELVSEISTTNMRFIQYIAGRITNEVPKDLQNWGTETGEKRASLATPIQSSLEQFKIFRGIFLSYFENFLLNSEDEVSLRQILEWNKTINEAFDEMIQQFTHAYFSYTTRRLLAQEEMIDELSTPVISITDGIAVLPLVGDIDTHRAKILMEHALNESSKKNVNCMIIDLSGVLIVDTMVAQELFKIIAALNLTGVDVTLTGMRPELASSVTSLGIRFENIKIYNNLEQALKELGITRK